MSHQHLTAVTEAVRAGPEQGPGIPSGPLPPARPDPGEHGSPIGVRARSTLGPGRSSRARDHLRKAARAAEPLARSTFHRGAGSLAKQVKIISGRFPGQTLTHSNKETRRFEWLMETKISTGSSSLWSTPPSDSAKATRSLSAWPDPGSWRAGSLTPALK